MSSILTVRGRFSPFTRNDLKVLREYLEKYDAIEIVLEDDAVSREDRANIIARTVRKSDEIFISHELSEEAPVTDSRLDRGITRKNLSEMSRKAAEYCVENMLYIREIAERTLSEKRFYHVLCVAKLSAELAEHFGIPYYKGYAAGLLHDITKEWSKPRQAHYIAKYRPEMVEKHPKTYHQYSAQIYVQRRFQVSDAEILDAIGNHVNGTDLKTLSKIVFCSDKIDDSRGFDNAEYKKLCFEDLDAAYQQIRDSQFRYLRKVLQKEREEKEHE